MRACLILCYAAALVGAFCLSVGADCDACIYGRCYRKHALPFSADEGWTLDIDRSRNIFYVTLRGVLQQCQLDTGTCNGTDTTWKIYRFTVDQRTGNTYGIIPPQMRLYKLDLVNKTMELVDRRVRYISFRDKLYYAKFNGNGIYTFEDGESRIVAGTEAYRVLNFVIDKNEDIYFHIIDDVIRRLSKGVVDQTVHWDGGLSIAVDREGNAVFIDPDSGALYRVSNGEQVEVGVFNDLRHEGYFFDNPLFDRDNNVIYGRAYHTSYFHFKQDRHVNCMIIHNILEGTE